MAELQRLKNSNTFDLCQTWRCLDCSKMCCKQTSLRNHLHYHFVASCYSSSCRRPNLIGTRPLYQGPVDPRMVLPNQGYEVWPLRIVRLFLRGSLEACSCRYRFHCRLRCHDWHPLWSWTFLQVHHVARSSFGEQLEVEYLKQLQVR